MRLNTLQSAAALACTLLVTTSDAVLLTLVEPNVVPDLGAGDPALYDEYINQDTMHVMGASSTQRNAVFTIEEGPGGNGRFGIFHDMVDDNDADTLAQGHNSNVSPLKQSNLGSPGGIKDVTVGDAGITTLPGRYTTDPIFQSTQISNITAGNYLTFAHDMNVANGQGANPHITYLSLQVWISPTQVTTEYDFDTLGTPPDPNGNFFGSLVWDLDSEVDRSLTMLPSNNGSGTTDILMYFNVLDFLDADPNATSDSFIYFWAQIETYGETQNDRLGVVENDPESLYLVPNTDLNTVPEPSAFGFILGLAALCVAGRRRGVKHL